MREIRTFELDPDDAATGWHVDRPQTLEVSHGQLWVTVQGEAGDIWLGAGETLELAPRSKIWVSAPGTGGRFAISAASSRGVRRTSVLSFMGLRGMTV